MSMTNANAQENRTMSMMSLIIIRRQDYARDPLSIPILHGGDMVAETAEVVGALPLRVELCS